MKKVVVTGATSGIGLSTAELLLERGYQVMMVGTSEEKASKILPELKEKYKENVQFCKCDVSVREEVKHLFEETLRSFGGVDGIVNNAGIFVKGELHQVSEEEWDRIFDVNVKSIYLMSCCFVPYMKENGGGSIVNTASVSGLCGDYNMASYNAAKGAVVNLMRAMALDYGKYNIRVNNVCPSACATPMFMKNPQDVVEKFNNSNPIGRICTPEEVAKAIYFLLSDESTSCNGMNLTVSGGIEMYSGQPVQL